MFLNALYTILAFGVFLYLVFPSPSFPRPLADSVQSLEDADTESPLRRAYFTNYDREGVIAHYQQELGKINILGLKIDAYRLNYPPEEAYTIIRDQTRSTFLEEVVHPFRESVYINGFKPKVAKDEIWYKGKHYEQKITVRYVSSPLFIRLILFSISSFLLWVVISHFARISKKFIAISRKRELLARG